MDIKKIATYGNQNPTMVQETELKSAEQAKQATKVNAAGETSDRVQISKDYQEMGKIKQVLMDMPEIRTERVNKIQNMIQSGTYQVDPGLVAGKILDELA
jgi:negative regulator of flagellin synthesis FlgM